MEDYPNEEHIVKILETKNVTHNVKRFKLSKPDLYTSKPGQATIKNLFYVYGKKI